MKVWIVSVLLCAAFTLQITEGAAVISPKEAAEIVPENFPEIFPGSVVEISPEEVAEISPEEVAEIYAEEAEHQQNLMNELSGRSVICPPGWFRHGARCFLLVKTGSTWLSAETYCINNQANLASVQSLSEYSFLQSLLTVSGSSTAWIGAYNFLGTWMWKDNAGFYYSNWQSQSSVASNPCAYMRSNGGWSNTICGTAYPFFCAMNPSTC